MKTKQTLLAFALLFCSTLAFALTPTEAEKKRCYIENATDSTITFLYPMGTGYFSQGTYSALYVYGSMNGWGQDARYKMELDAASNCYFVTLKWDVMNIPGNSGHPEFKFYRNGSWVDNPSWMDTQYRFAGGNLIVVFSYENMAEVQAQSAFAKVVRPLSSFDLTDSVDQHKISNFRRVPGTTCLYRSYHPYHAYRAQYDTEHMRLTWIDSLATRAGIQNDICLSENESGKMNSYTCGGVKYTEKIPAYYQNIIANNGVLYVGTQNGKTPSYNDVYFNSTGKLFGQWVAEVVDFIIDPAHPGPFQIHCALGTDRTGVFSATLAALCGATWQEVSDDYQYTNNMQIEEYRDKGILAYSFRKMCGVYDMNSVTNLQQAIANYFITNGYLTQAHIDCLQQKLNGVQPTNIPNKYIIPTPQASGQYKAITVKCYSPNGAPTIWWWDGGDRITKTSETTNPATGAKFTWDTRPAMPSVASAWAAVNETAPEDVADWYYWTFTNVDASLGINYIFTAAGKSKSADLNAMQDECRDASYKIVDACPELPSRVIKDWNVSNTTLFGTAPTNYSATTEFDGLTVHCYNQDARRLEISACNETFDGQTFTQMATIGGAAKETYRYITFDGEQGQLLDIYAKGGSNIHRALYVGIGDYSSDNAISVDSIYADRINHISYVLPQKATYYIYTQKGNWYWYDIVLSAAPEATQPGTAVEDVFAEKKDVRKVIENGRLYIYQGNVKYNALGQIVGQ